MSNVVSYELNGEIGIITIDNPPVNSLSQPVREGVRNAVDSAQTDPSKVILLTCAGRTFITGADLTEFGKPPKAPSLAEVLSAIENSNKPIIAVIHGTALGDGLETALSCHYRFIQNSGKVGLPEVKLGLLPGAGGTQRLPRLVGIESAINIITSGKPLDANQALDNNIVDQVIVNDNLQEEAIKLANELVSTNATTRKIRDIEIDAKGFDEDYFAAQSTKFAKKTRGQLAPQNILKCIQATLIKTFDEGLAYERELFIECMKSTQSVALRHIFFAEREAAKVQDLNKNTPLRDIRSVGIIGGGTMGGGIAMNFANVGIPVTLLDINNETVERGLGIIKKNYSSTVKKGRMSQENMDQCMTLIKGSTEYETLADVDLVIEAVFENLELKMEVFTKLDLTCKDGAILATNTSYQDVNKIAAVTSNPQNVIGLHFFSPANIMKLLEVVRADQTADDVLATCMRLAKTIGKVPVLSGVCYGFIGNRMLRNYARESQLCLMEGASPEQIDNTLQKWGMAMGPLAVGDLAGLDISYKARETLTAEQKGDPKTYCITDSLVESGRLGQKNGKGYYRYDPDTRARENDPIVQQVIEEQAAAHGVERRQLDEVEILNRHIFALVNEGARILKEGIAQRSGDIDVVYVYGYGFPAFRGGPMHYADTVGLKTVYDTICEYHDKTGQPYWEPAPLLEQLVKENKSFAEFSA